jgi:hypothetical protein
MTGNRIRLTIDTLRIHGGTQGDAAALAEGLKTALADWLAENPGALSGAEHVRLSVPGSGRGAALGARIAGALTAGKEGAG